MKIKAEIKLRGCCKYCGKWVKFKEISNHMAYEHDIYHSNWYKFKAKIRKILRSITNER